MIMLANAYSTTRNCSDQLYAHILVAGFMGQLEGRQDEHLKEEDKYNIFHSVKTSFDGTPNQHGENTKYISNIVIHYSKNLNR